MAKSKFIVVTDKVTRLEKKRICVDHLYGDFQIGYEAGKLVSEYPEEHFNIFYQKIKL